MAENSENPLTNPENPPTTPDAPPKKEATSPVLAPVPEEERPKTRGRPKGSKDAKPRIRRVPVVIEQEEEEEEEEPAAPNAAAKAAAKRVQVKEPEPEVAQEPDQPEPQEPPPQKSPRTLHREHAQAIATERRKLAQAKQAHYEGLFDRNLSW